MKIRFSEAFIEKLERQIRYIANDKPKAARNFRKALRERISEIPKRPYSFRRNPYYSDREVRELIFNGYTVSFVIEPESNSIYIFSFTQWDEPAQLP